jgi:hypothetical protein
MSAWKPWTLPKGPTVEGEEEAEHPQPLSPSSIHLKRSSKKKKKKKILKDGSSKPNTSITSPPRARVRGSPSASQESAPEAGHKSKTRPGNDSPPQIKWRLAEREKT